MLVPNATLLVQLVNFIIAYCVVNFLIVKPVIALIWQEDALAESLQEAVQQRQLIIENKRHELESYWMHCKVHFAQHTPLSSQRQPPLTGKAHMNIVGYDAVDQEKRVDKLAQAIAAEVDHVR